MSALLKHESLAALRSGHPNVGHRVRDGQRRQRAATLEGTIPNVGDRVWDG